MKIIYQNPFEDIKVPKPEESELWDIYVTKHGSSFIYEGSMWLVLFDSNLDKDVSKDFLFLILNNKGLYKEILDDLEFLDITRSKTLNKENLVYRSFRKNIENILENYEKRTINSND